MRLSHPVAALLSALLIGAPASAANADLATDEQAGQECVEYNGKVVYCIDYR